MTDVIELKEQVRVLRKNDHILREALNLERKQVSLLKKEVKELRNYILHDLTRKHDNGTEIET